MLKGYLVSKKGVTDKIKDVAQIRYRYREQKQAKRSEVTERKGKPRGQLREYVDNKSVFMERLCLCAREMYGRGCMGNSAA